MKTFYISLGGTCAISYHLKSYHLKTNSIHTTLVFDWCKISLNQLIEVLSKNFHNYLLMKKIQLKSSHNSYVFTNNYNIQYAHEIFQKYNLTSSFTNKLQNRILKFVNICKCSNILKTFIRFETNIYKTTYNQKLLILLNLLFQFCDNNPFHLILIVHSSYKNKILNLPSFCKIHIHYYNNFSSDWKYPNIDFDKILQS